jgi:CheY-like chemotaxis protein
MAGAIAHHFNNQHGVVIGNLELALGEVKKGVQPLLHINAAMKGSLKAAEMSRLMITYLGQSFDKREALDLADTCLRDLPLLQAVMPGNVLLNTDLPLPGPAISANANQMQQVLTNLITNAQEAAEEGGGSISLSVKQVLAAKIPAKNRFPVDFQSKDNTYACLEVKDTGCGIENKDIEKLFDPFYSTKFTGRGMGLAVVLGIVKAHKGVITVDSEVKRGSIFRIFLPMSTEEVVLIPQKSGSIADTGISAASSTKLKEGGTVLLVEDEAMVREMAETMLESLGYCVLIAKDGIEALDVFGKHQSEIQFVLTDLTMPRMSGWATLTAMRKLQPGLPVILASGYDKAHVMAGDHLELPQTFLAKPYNLKALSSAIGIAMGKKAEGV